MSAALAGLFFSLQLCLGGDSSIGIFDFQYFCVINCFLRFISVQLDLPQEIPFKESLLLVLQNFQLLLILRAFGSGTAGKATNHIYSDSHLLINLQEQQEGVFEGEIAFYIADPLELDTLLERVEAIDSIDWDNHILRENDFQYEQIAGQLQNLQNLAVALIALAATLGIVILMLILMVQIRGRIREAGIYLSVGKPKMEIIGQFGLEAWGLLIVGFLSAFLLWLFCSGPVNGLLFGTLAQGTGTAALQTGGGGVNYLQPNLLNSGVLLAGELAAVLLTVLVASGAILRLKPKEILTKMS